MWSVGRCGQSGGVVSWEVWSVGGVVSREVWSVGRCGQSGGVVSREVWSVGRCGQLGGVVSCEIVMICGQFFQEEALSAVMCASLCGHVWGVHWSVCVASQSGHFQPPAAGRGESQVDTQHPSQGYVKSNLDASC